jgi:hypothetical protein
VCIFLRNHVQDASLLQRTAYQQKMSAWLAEAEPIRYSQLHHMCKGATMDSTTDSAMDSIMDSTTDSTTDSTMATTTDGAMDSTMETTANRRALLACAPAVDNDSMDLIVHYDTNKTFGKIALKLSPMLHDLKV